MILLRKSPTTLRAAQQPGCNRDLLQKALWIWRCLQWCCVSTQGGKDVGVNPRILYTYYTIGWRSMIVVNHSGYILLIQFYSADGWKPNITTRGLVDLWKTIRTLVQNWEPAIQRTKNRVFVLPQTLLLCSSCCNCQVSLKHPIPTVTEALWDIHRWFSNASERNICDRSW